MRMWKWRPWVVVGLLILIAYPVRPAGASELEAIRKAIREAGAEWTADETPVSRLSTEERRALLGIPAGWVPDPADVLWDAPTGDAKAPTSFDWRNQDGHDWTTPVKNQAYCGACMAFAALGAVESVIKIEDGNPGQNPNLSEQHLFSCGGGHCATGMTPEQAFNYLLSQGVPDESCFPYASGNDGYDRSCSQSCDDWRDRATKIQNWYHLSSPASIKEAIVAGPVATYLEIYEDFYYYSGGIYTHEWGADLGAHAVTIVGYNDSQQYWIVKNSWGTEWGESGYGRIRYGEVGIAQYATVVKVAGGTGDDDDDAGDDDQSDDDDDRNCEGVCNKFVTCGYTSDFNACMERCDDIRSDIFLCVDAARSCEEVDACLGDQEDDDAALCQEICEKFYACGLMRQDQAQLCLDSCLDEFGDRAKDCLDAARSCDEVEACAGISGDDESGGDDDDGGAGFGCAMRIGDAGTPALAVVLGLLVGGGMARWLARQRRP